MMQYCTLSASAIFIILGVLVVIITLFIKCNCGRVNECKGVYCHRLKEHDYKFCMVILFFVIVFVCTVSMGNNDEVSKLLSFAGTLSSIILSVLAIILTLLADKKAEYERLKTDNLVSHMDSYANQIQESLNKAQSIVKKLKGLEAKVNVVLEKEEELIQLQKEIKADIAEYCKSTNDVPEVQDNYGDDHYGSPRIDNENSDDVNKGKGGETGD